MKKILVVAPHGDDEVLGCGGAILRDASEGAEVHWALVTGVTASNGYAVEVEGERAAELRKVRRLLGISALHELNFPPARLEGLPMGKLIDALGAVVRMIAADEVYLPFWGDAHSDHRVVFEAGASATKWFRYPSVRRVLCYETPSETDQQLNSSKAIFVPNRYVNVAPWLERKLEALAVYKSEVQEYPGPRSKRAVRALAEWRGAQSGFDAAEAFMVIRERE
ncbi:MAG: PIG-L family deacetylase [Bdellovibrionales bacterium]|nr:PIG-L family deacetylase [Bdellovibrionales bacterium]